MSLALLFTPQGSQAVGMGRALADGSPAARAVFDEADAVLGWSVSATCWDGPPERLDDTRQTQPCLLTTSIAALRALEEQVPLAPAFVAGHSVGEYAALVAINDQLLTGFGYQRGASHSEYMKAHADGLFYFIETSARELGISTLGMPEVISVYEAAVQQGLAKQDISAIAEVLP